MDKGKDMIILKEGTYGYTRDIFNMVCISCGCEFSVEVSGQKGRREREEYSCPECGKYYGCSASNPPIVTLLKPRTDGRIGHY